MRNLELKMENAPEGSDRDNLKWKSISDFEVSTDELRDSELRSLSDLWLDRKIELEKLGSYSEFMDRLTREWAIETGLIERLYHFDRGITQTLIAKGLSDNLIPANASRNPQQTVQIIQDHREALEAVFDFVKGDRRLTTSYIREIHACLVQHQDTCEAMDPFGKIIDIPLTKGDYKKTPNDPTRPNGEVIHEYCPPVHVAAEMERLIEFHDDHTDKEISPEVEAAWLHHRFTSIHPFQDGNGRVARTLASLVFLKAGWFPLVVRDEDREIYIDALEDADRGALGPLVEYFAYQQKRTIEKALQLATDVEQENQVEKAIAATKARLVERRDALSNEMTQACEIANLLHERTVRTLIQVSTRLTEELTPVLKGAYFTPSNEPYQGSRDHYYKKEIVAVAKDLDYFADLRTYRSWVRLTMNHGIRGVLLVSFHGLGKEFNGLLACSPIWFELAPVDSEEADANAKYEPMEPISLRNEVFRINSRESREASIERFDPFLDFCIARAISFFEMGAM